MESVLLQYGVLGVFCAWLMWRVETRLDSSRDENRGSIAKVTESVDRLTRAQLLALVSRPEVEEQVKREARAILAECPSVAPQLVGVER